MKDGRLSNKEKQTLWSAHKILNRWIDWQEEHGKDFDTDDALRSACMAAGELLNLLSWIDD